MKVDIIGSKFTRKLTEFKNFRFEINNIVEGQSILSLFSEPYETTMKDLNTTDLGEITVAYRDLNKLLYENLKKSDAEVIIIELLSELNDISEYEHSFYNTSSLELLNNNYVPARMTDIEKFRAFQRNFGELIRLLNQYEKVIFLRLPPKSRDKKEFIEGLYQLLEENVAHKLLLSVDNSNLNENLEAPLEVYNKVNDDLRKFSSDNYYNQMLFEESLVNDILSVYVNHVEARVYVFELYKNGKPYHKSEPTKSRYYDFKLNEPGKYRIRVNLVEGDINPRFSQTYEYEPQRNVKSSSEPPRYIEIPDYERLWMLNLIISKHDFMGLIGNPYKYPNGYRDQKVLMKEEIGDEQFVRKENLFNYVVDITAVMGPDEFDQFLMENRLDIKKDNELFVDFLNYLNKSRN